MRWWFSALVLLIAVSAIINSANAQSLRKLSALCVQKQLNALGHDVGEADGALGKGSFKGYSSLLKAREDLALPKKLSNATSATACRVIGYQEPDMRAHWPSADGLLSIASDPKLPVGVSDYVLRATPFVVKRLAAFDLQLASKVKIHIYRDEAAGETLYSASEGGKKKTARKAFKALHKRHCKPDTVSSWLTFNRIYICINVKEGAKINGNDLQYVLSRELFLTSVNELLGFPSNRFKRKTRENQLLKQRGPQWLWHGAARYFEYRFVLEDKPEDVYFAELAKYLADKKLSLSKYEKLPKKAAGAVHDLGSNAVHQLAKLRSEKSIGSFYRSVALGAPWKKAFSKAFGTAPADFYEQLGAS